MQFSNLAVTVSMAALALSAPLEGCDQGVCPAIHAGFDLIEGHNFIGNEIRINAHGVCYNHILSGDGCATWAFNGGYEEKVCVDRARNRATRTGTKKFKFHQCWQLHRSIYCNGKALWTPSKEIPCDFFAAEEE